MPSPLSLEPEKDDLQAFLLRQPLSRLVQVLLELAQHHEPVQERLARLRLADRPAELAADFRKVLTGWKRSTRFRSYREAQEFGQEMEAWLDQVAQELMPRDPEAARKLFDAFILADGAWFEHADDSDGSIGDAVRAACRHWLRAAALTGKAAQEWTPRLIQLYRTSEYGAREELLRCADLLLDEAGMRGLVLEFEAQLVRSLAEGNEHSANRHERYQASGALSLLAEALHDPDVEVADAESRLVFDAATIDGGSYPTLVPLAEALRAHS